MSKPSSFLEPSLRSAPGDLAIILLARDAYQPITLDQSSGSVHGYAEGAVLNTRFGSFPHSTFIDVPWGSQVRASIVDTGSRGRKRRREGDDDSTAANTPTKTTATTTDDAAESTPEPASKKVVTASSGFVHMLRPTPELWTSSLPHRTQVVYTPDYSYILSRLRARPGTRIIEAGAGSGSFTHASARAVYSGYPSGEGDRHGKVFSFEFNESRFHKMREEVTGHGLDGIVNIAHRDVYKDGFLVDGQSPDATAVFLDLPAPWEALRHLSRRGRGVDGSEPPAGFVSPLDPNKTVRICTFSPCIEQVQQTVTDLRRLGWTDVDMVEVSHKRINVVRDRIGSSLPKDKGFLSTPADVMESVHKLRQHNRRTQNFHGKPADSGMDVDSDAAAAAGKSTDKPWLHGRLVHRPEAEIKTHTSYLVFAILPREWSDDQEEAALAKWPCGGESRTIGGFDKAARKKEKQEMLQPKKQKRDTA